MSAWIRSVTGRAYHFEPLNAKQLERPSPFIIEADLESAGCELVEETSQGFASLSPYHQQSGRLTCEWQRGRRPSPPPSARALACPKLGGNASRFRDSGLLCAHFRLARASLPHPILLPGECARLGQPWPALPLRSCRNAGLLLVARQRLVVFPRGRRQARSAADLRRCLAILRFGPALTALLAATHVPYPVAAPPSLDCRFTAFSRGAAPLAEATPVRRQWARHLRRRSPPRTCCRFSVHISSLDADATLDWQHLRDRPYCVCL